MRLITLEKLFQDGLLRCNENVSSSFSHSLHEPSPPKAWKITALGPRAVIGNHGLQVPLKDAAEPLYAELKKIGPPLELQFYNPKIDLEPSIQLALDTGATEIEVWESKDGKGLCPVTYAQPQHWATRMK